MIIILLFLTLIMRNKKIITNKSPPKLIILNGEGLSQSKPSSKMFRRVKKAIKIVNVCLTPKYVDQGHIKSQLKDWIFKINDSKNLELSQRSRHSRMNTIDFSSEKLYQIYSDLRADEKVVKVPILDTPKIVAHNPSPIKLNLQEVDKMRSGLENTKIVLTPKDFQTDLHERPSSTIGFRPIPYRFDKQSSSKKNLMGMSLNQKKRCMTERKELFTIDHFEKHLPKAPETPKSASKWQGLSSSHRGKKKKIWETIGLHQWNNFH